MVMNNFKFLLFALSLVTSSALAEPQALLIHAARLFDGYEFKTDTSVLVVDGKVAQIGQRGTL